MGNYLLDGGCLLSNNIPENSIRLFTVGRKKWVFFNSQKDAKVSATV